MVGFSGASGTGKSTLVNILHDRLIKDGYKVAKITEVAREVFNTYAVEYEFESLSDLRNGRDNLWMEYQYDILKHQVDLENKYYNEGYDIVLSDRTIYDNLYYSIPAATFCTDKKLIDKYMQLFYKAHARLIYDLIFFTSIIPSNDIYDGFRNQDVPSRQLQSFCIYWFLPSQFMPGRVHVLSNTNLKYRVDYCLNEIRLYLNKLNAR